jgi:hypothetical protein
MNLWILPLALLCGLSLAAAAFALFALWRTHHLARTLNWQSQAVSDQRKPETETLQKSIEALGARVRELERGPSAPEVARIPRLGLNMSKRSQALRMHRLGEGPEQIAEALALPRQEVDLLLKIHHIVISKIS